MRGVAETHQISHPTPRVSASETDFAIIRVFFEQIFLVECFRSERKEKRILGER